MSRPRAAAALLAAALFAAASAAAEPLRVLDAWVNPGPPVARMAAAYLVIENPGDQAVEILGASSPAILEVQLHRTVVTDGVARMRETTLPLAPGERIDFRDSGHHLMLFLEGAAPLEAGGRLPVTLDLGAAGSLDLELEVRAPDAEPGHHEHHGHHEH